MARSGRRSAPVLLVLLFALYLGSLPPARAQSSPPAAALVSKVERSTLPNGVSVFVREDRRAPLVALNLAFEIGSAHDPADAAGFAQLMQRIIARASTRHVRREDRESVIGALGLHPWSVEVYAGRDATNIRLLVPKRAFELALWLESDRVGFFADGIDASSLSSAIDLFESDDRKEDSNLEWRLRRRAISAALGGDVSFAGLPALDKLRALSPGEVRAHVARRYGADRLSVSVVGDVQAKQAQQLIARYFGDLPRSGLAKLPVVSPTLPKSAVKIELSADTEHDWSCLVWRTAGYATNDDVVLDVVARMLIARLGRRLVHEESKAANRIHVQQSSRTAISMFDVCFEAASGHSLDESRRVIDEELAKLRAGQLDDAELAAGKTARLIETGGELDDPASTAYNLNAFWRLRRDPGYFWTYREAYRAIDRAKLSDVVKRQLPVEPHAVATARKGSAKAEAPAAAQKLRPHPLPDRLTAARRLTDAPFRYRPPAVGPVERFTPSVAHDLRLTSGSRVLVQHQPNLVRQLLRMSVVWNGKAPCCEASRFLGDLLVHSALPDGRTLRETARQLGSYVDVDADDDSIELTMHLLPDQLEAAATALVAAIQSKKLDAARLADLKKGRLEWIAKEPPDQKLRAWVDAVLLPPGSRSHRVVSERAARIGKLSLNDLRDYGNREIRGGSIGFSVVGPTPPDAVRAALEKATKSLRKGTAKRRPALPLRSGVTLLDDPSAKEALVVAYVPMARWGEPGHAESHALRWFFGTAASTQPNMGDRLAEAKVSTYSNEYANLHVFDGTLTLVFYIKTAPSDVAGVLRAVLAQLEKLREGAIPPVGVASARRELSTWIFEQSSSSTGRLQQLAGINVFDAAADAHASLYSRAFTLDRDQLSAVAARYLKPEHVCAIALGPVLDSRAAIEELGLTVTSEKP